MKTKLCRCCGEEKDQSQFYLTLKTSRKGKKTRYFDRTCKKCRLKYNRAYRSPVSAEKRREYHLRDTYGIPAEMYDVLLAIQGGGCAICGASPEIDGCRLAIDHDHDTGKIRALLCRKCNTGLGNFREDPDLLRRAVAYLERHGEHRA